MNMKLGKIKTKGGKWRKNSYVFLQFLSCQITIRFAGNRTSSIWLLVLYLGFYRFWQIGFFYNIRDTHIGVYYIFSK